MNRFIHLLTLILLVHLSMNTNLRGQVYFEIHDLYFDFSIVSGVAGFPSALQEAMDRPEAEWTFEHVEGDFYTIANRSSGLLLASTIPYNGSLLQVPVPSELDSNYLWRLEDVDGQGRHFRISDQKYGLYLHSKTVNPDGTIAHIDTTMDFSRDLNSIWRLVRKDGTGILPKDVAGEEIAGEIEYRFTNTPASPIIPTIYSVYGLGGTLCGAPSGAVAIDNNDPTLTDMNLLAQTNPSQYIAIPEQRLTDLYVYAQSAYVLPEDGTKLTLTYPGFQASELNPNWQGTISETPIEIKSLISIANNFFYRARIPIDQNFGSIGSVLTLSFDEYLGFSYLNTTQLKFPLQIAGPIQKEVPSLGTTVFPQTPDLILHDPPGNGSVAELVKGSTICREQSFEVQQESSSSSFLEASIGIAGEAGLIVSTNFEVSASVKTSGGSGEIEVTTSTNETCITVKQGFSTSDLGGANNKDLFIGYGTDLKYGLYDVVSFPEGECQAVQAPAMVFVPIGERRAFIYTESRIRQEIADLNNIFNDSALDAKTRDNAKAQIKAWEDALAVNEQNKAEASESFNNSSFSFSSNAGSYTWEEEITISETRSFSTQHYVELTTGLSGKIEVSATGVEGGSEFTMKKNYGKSATNRNDSTQLTRFILKDDVPVDDVRGDIYNVEVVKDPMYGTPVFRLAQGSRTSCPYEGGYQRDQPNITVVGGETPKDISLLDVAVGTVASFQLNICNDSNEDRDYEARLLGVSNPNGARVSIGGNEISGNNLASFKDVPPNQCLSTPFTVTVEEVSNQLSYPDLKIVLGAEEECDVFIKDTITASVFFTMATSVVDVPDAFTMLNVYPNPVTSQMYLVFSLKEKTEVQYQLYDALGRPVAQKAPQTLLAGDHQLEWNVSHLPAGTYQLVIQAGKDISSRRIIVQP